MWLLDVNLPKGLVGVLKNLGIESDTTVACGWRELGNGTLVKAASQAGFDVILTRDRLFGESAGQALKLFPAMSIVVVRLSQAREATYLKEFERAWA